MFSEQLILLSLQPQQDQMLIYIDQHKNFSYIPF
jgi:hypothetical protein